MHALRLAARTGEPLDPGEVRKAQRREIEFFRQMGVYRKVPANEPKEPGHHVLGVRWLDVRKADGTHRSRPVAKDIKTHNAPELFAATPPIESLK